MLLELAQWLSRDQRFFAVFNYITLRSSMMATFQTIDNENWDDLLKSHMAALGSPSALYFVAVIYPTNKDTVTILIYASIKLH